MSEFIGARIFENLPKSFVARDHQRFRDKVHPISVSDIRPYNDKEGSSYKIMELGKPRCPPIKRT
jgi:hypothetical protein